MTGWLWITFAALVSGLVVLDLFLLTRRPRAVSPSEARASLALWVLSALGFSILLSHVYQTNWQSLGEILSDPILGAKPDGESAWLQFVTCYILEIALSLDNIAVLVILYTFYKVPRAMLARVLFWNVVASLVARFAMIHGAATVLRLSEWFHWVLGGVLLLAVLRVLVLPDEQTDFDRRWYVRLLRRVVPVVQGAEPNHLITHVNGRLAITPLMLVVLTAALLDVAFAIDSVPALLSVTKEPFIAFSASAFAVLALRSLYLALAGSVGRFRYLKISIAAVLLIVTVKMFLARTHDEFRDLPTLITLAGVSGIMMIGVGASVWRNRVLQERSGDLLVAPRPAPIEDITEAVDATRRNLRKVAILIAGTVVIIVGVMITPLPGPGPMVLIPLGLGILATEFVWARSLLQRLKTGAFNLSDQADRLVDRTTIWFIPLVLIGWWLVASAAWWLITTRQLDERLIGRQIPWYLYLVIFGSPFVPVLTWAFNYLRKRYRRGGPPPPPPPPTSSGSSDQR